MGLGGGGGWKDNFEKSFWKYCARFGGFREVVARFCYAVWCALKCRLVSQSLVHRRGGVCNNFSKRS